MSIRHIKMKFQVHITLCTEQFTDTNRFTFSHIGQLTSSEHANVHGLYYLLLHLFPSLCHILYFDAAKFSKLFSLIYFTVSVVRQRNENDIEIETRPIKLSFTRC